MTGSLLFPLETVLAALVDQGYAPATIDVLRDHAIFEAQTRRA